MIIETAFQFEKPRPFTSYFRFAPAVPSSASRSTPAKLERFTSRRAAAVLPVDELRRAALRKM